MKRLRCLHCQRMFELADTRRERFCCAACRHAELKGTDTWEMLTKSTTPVPERRR